MWIGFQGLLFGLRASAELLRFHLKVSRTKRSSSPETPDSGQLAQERGAKVFVHGGAEKMDKAKGVKVKFHVSGRIHFIEVRACKMEDLRTVGLLDYEIFAPSLTTASSTVRRPFRPNQMPPWSMAGTR